VELVVAATTGSFGVKWGRRRLWRSSPPPPRRQLAASGGGDGRARCRPHQGNNRLQGSAVALLAFLSAAITFSFGG